MKTLVGLVLIVLSITFMVWGVVAEVQANYELDNGIFSYWSLSDKASTLDAKANYLNLFVGALKGSGLSGHNAIWLKTPDNDFDHNLQALETLQSRMNEIKGMDVSSFAYQQAISQITAQEQGQAKDLLDTLAGVWYLEHHPLLWDWIDCIKWLVLITMLFSGIGFLVADC